MSSFLKGNYELSNSPTQESGKGSRSKKASKSLTEKFEESTLAKLGGSICFVMKGKTFVWTGGGDEEASA
ncbi:hypothetical protein M1N45_01415 [Dehalococcoidia bacterium]|nr:hypothetical protein [Dehalococcoidia bacterium]